MKHGGYVLSEQHGGFYVSNTRNEALLRLLHGCPTATLLQRGAQEFALLLPATCKPVHVQGKRSLVGDVLLERSNAVWLSSLGDVRRWSAGNESEGCDELG